MTQATDFNAALREDAIDIRVTADNVVQAPQQATDYLFDFQRDDVQTFERVDDTLIIILNDGSVVQIIDYYASVYENALLFRVPDDAGAGTLSSSALLLGGGGLLALAGIGAAASGGGGGDGGPSTNTVTITDTGAGADNTVNNAERLAGVTMTGTANAGSVVTVHVNGKSESTVADGNGTWTVTFPTSDLPSGEQNVTVLAEATDPNGIQGVQSATLDIDTLVDPLTLDTVPGGSNKTLNSSEAAQGLSLNGTVEPNSTVDVEFNGKTYTAVVQGNGNWTLDIPAADVPTGNGTAFDIKVNATDQFGNKASVTESFNIDTTAPIVPAMSNADRDQNDEASQVTLAPIPDGQVSFFEDAYNNGINAIAHTNEQVSLQDNKVEFTLAQKVQNLIVQVEDTAGNTASSFHVFDTDSGSIPITLNDPSIGNHNINLINMNWTKTDLTLTEADVLALSSHTDTLIVHGNGDDTVTMTGAVAGNTVSDGLGNNFIEYTLGQATIWIDQDLQDNGVVVV